MSYGQYGDGGAYIIGSGSRALGPGYGAINLGDHIPGQPTHIPPVPFQQPIKKYTGGRGQRIIPARPKFLVPMGHPGHYGSNAAVETQAEMVAALETQAQAAGSMGEEVASAFPSELPFMEEGPGMFFDEVEGRYQSGVDYLRDQYLSALMQTEDSMLKIVNEVDKKVERQQRYFLIGLAAAFAVPLLLFGRR